MFLDLNLGLTGNKICTLNYFTIELHCGEFKNKVGNLFPIMLAMSNNIFLARGPIIGSL